MKILIGCNQLSSIGGSQSHSRSLGIELTRQDHEITYMTARDVPDTSDFDLALLSHTNVLNAFFDKFPYFQPRKVVQTCHGLAPRIEAPYTKRNIRRIGVSREIRFKHPVWIEDVILNGIDLNEYRPIHSPRKDLKVVLSLMQSDELNNVLRKICRERKLVLTTRNKFLNGAMDIVHEMQDADLVIGVGRSCYEPMACGRVVLICDDRPYQLPLADGYAHKVYPSAIGKNCSGRTFQIEPTYEYLSEQLDEYDHKAGAECRWIAGKHHNIEDSCRKYLELIEEGL